LALQCRGEEPPCSYDGTRRHLSSSGHNANSDRTFLSHDSPLATNRLGQLPTLRPSPAISSLSHCWRTDQAVMLRYVVVRHFGNSNQPFVPPRAKEGGFSVASTPQQSNSWKGRLITTYPRRLEERDAFVSLWMGDSIRCATKCLVP
jgi:hypothetical protein